MVLKFKGKNWGVLLKTCMVDAAELYSLPKQSIMSQRPQSNFISLKFKYVWITEWLSMKTARFSILSSPFRTPGEIQSGSSTFPSPFRPLAEIQSGLFLLPSFGRVFGVFCSFFLCWVHSRLWLKSGPRQIFVAQCRAQGYWAKKDEKKNSSS